MTEHCYPSGRPMPTYGPRTEDEIITDAMEWAVAALIARDQMNAAIHCTATRLSPVTVKLQTALGLWLLAGLASRDGPCA